MCFHFGFCFFSWYSYSNYKFRKWIKIYAITAGIKKYKSVTKKKKEKHDKIVLLAKSKLNRIEVLISTTLIDSVISHDEFAFINNQLKQYNEMKEEIKNPKI